jgi:hypothetical protein
MIRHRLIFTGGWLAGVASLLSFPGFEAKGLAGGLIAGSWPFLVFEVPHGNPLLVFGLKFPLSGLAVWACAWTMDKAKLRKKACLILLLGVAAGALTGYLWKHDGFENWQQSPAVSAATEAPELNYEPSTANFNRSILIPVMLMCGMWGLYGICCPKSTMGTPD